MTSRSSVALDQWRGLALVLVLISHGLYFTDRVHGAGRVGVNLFFFISGVLVFRSLSGKRGAASFWWRRLKRLYPALLAYVAIMLPVGLQQSNGYLDSAPSALLYTMNYTTGTAPISLGHLWSIACEMQFYALAPLILLIGGRVRILLLLGLVAAGLLGPLLLDLGPAKYHFEYAVWPMMLGFCCEEWKGVLERVPRRASRFLVRFSLVVFAGSLLLMPLGIGTKMVVIAGGSMAFAPCLFAYVYGQEVPGRVGRTLVWLGQRTYSIYLWQQPLTISGYLPTLLHPLGAVLSTLVGAVSFRWFERPFLSGSRQREAAVDPLPAPRVTLAP